MKRFLIFFVGIFFFVGCSSQSNNNSRILECNSSGNVGSTFSEQVYKIYFNDDKVDKLSMNVSVSLAEPDDVTRDNLENDVNNAFEAYKARDGITYSSNVKDNGFIVKLDINFNKLSETYKYY